MELRDRLQATLGDGFRIERELGGGGMSRVFVAYERRLERRIVVKVLSPDLAQGISADRFLREIRTAASLQQANIVPVLAAGDADGLPYFTMPFVDGESLRAPLVSGPLPVTEVVSILRDIARALAYAHARGIVHRDIKPDNVLLSGGTAMVTDFGIAKALEAAGKPKPHETNLTQMGTSLGTPAYMAPEQAAADPDIDLRADIYSLGCLAYELLSGQPPFAGRTPQRMLAAHMSEEPRAVESLRPDTPPGLAQLVMRSLAKDPAHRPQSAAEVTRELDAMASGTTTSAGGGLLVTEPGMTRRALAFYAIAFVVVAIVARAAVIALGLPEWVFPGALILMALGLPVILLAALAHRQARQAAAASPAATPGGTKVAALARSPLGTLLVRASPHLSWRRTMLGGGYALAGFALAIAAFMGLRALGIGPFGSLLAAGRVGDEPLLLTEFSTVRADSTLGAVISQAVRANLEQSSAIRIMPQGAVTAALQRMQRPPETRIDLSIAREIAAREGLRAIVDGEIAGIGDGFLVTLRLVSADSARLLASFHQPADGVKELIAVVDELSRKLRGRIGESLRDVRASPALSRVTTPSIDALRKFTEASRATAAGEEQRALALARDAVIIDSNFALGWRLLAEVMIDAGRPRASIDSAITRAYQLRDRLTERERLIVTGEYFGNGPGRDRARAIAAYETLVAMGDYENTNSLGNLLASRREFARAESFGRIRLRVDPGYLATYGNLIIWQLSQGKVAAAESTYALGAARFHNWEQERAVTHRTALLYARGDRARLMTLLDSAMAAQSGEQRATALSYRAALALQDGQLERRRRLLREAAVLRDPGREWFAIDDSIDAVASEAWLVGASPEHARRLDALIPGAGFDGAPLFERPYLYLARAYAFVGRPERARALLDRFETEVPDTTRARVSPQWREEVLAELALAERRTAEAIAGFRRADMAPDGPVNGCRPCLPASLARAFDAAGNADSTIAMLEQYLAIPPGARMGMDWLVLAPFERRLGELYDERGDRAKAAAHYRAFLDLWKNADPALQPRVRAVRERLASFAAWRGS